VLIVLNMLIKFKDVMESLGFEVGRIKTNAAGGDSVDVRINKRRFKLSLVRRSRSPFKAEIEDLKFPDNDTVCVLVAPFISETTGNHLVRAGWSWVDLSGNAHLNAEGLMIQRRVTAKQSMKVSGLPKGRGSWSVIRECINEAKIEGASRLGERVGVSQPRVSQILSGLVSLGYLEKTGRSVWEVNTLDLLEAFLSQYSGHGGASEQYYSLDSPRETAEKISLSLSAEEAKGVFVGGDLAADLISPWRAPTVLTIYSNMKIDFESLGIVEAQADEGNVSVHYPKDLSMFTDCSTDYVLPSVDKTQIVWDLYDLGGKDRVEAAEQLIEKTWN